MRFRIDSALYETVSDQREREWQLALTELNYEADGEPPTLTLHRRADGGVDVHIANEELIGVVALSFGLLRRHFREYRRVIEQLVRSTSTGTKQMETLDYAKKLVHDDAGDTVCDAFETCLTIDHSTARRLFTLIFLISNELPETMVTRHRHS
jgi:uncharacterized protein (UPF0262 family)